MSLFDTYIPVPALNCPVCGVLLEDDWQGKDGPCGLMVWRQGQAAPIDQQIAADARLPDDELARRRLPDKFTIRQPCCGGRFFVEARCHSESETWVASELVTAENARQRKEERRADFKARVAWLSGNAV